MVLYFVAVTIFLFSIIALALISTLQSLLPKPQNDSIGNRSFWNTVERIWVDLTTNNVSLSIAILGIAICLISVTSIFVKYYPTEFLKGVQVEMVGMVFDIVLLLVLFNYMTAKGETRLRITRYKEELDDYRGWHGVEAKFRVKGIMTRLEHLNVQDINPSGLHLGLLKKEFVVRAILNPLVENEELSLVGVKLSETDLREANLSHTALESSDFSRAKLTSAIFIGADLRHANFTEAKLQNSNFRGANLEECSLIEAELNNSDLSQARFLNTYARAAKLNGARLCRSILDGTDFTDAQLEGADLRGASFKNVITNRINMSNANMTALDLRGVKLHGTYLKGVNLVRVLMQGADLAEAVLANADLYKAQLNGSNMKRADLRKANLTDAILDGADLTDADLSGAFLNGAYIRGVVGLTKDQITSANYEGAIFDEDIKTILCRQ